MAYDSLAEFVKALDRAGELKRIRTTVSPDLEIAEITDRVSKAEGPALLFEKVEGSEMPLLINTYGSYRRWRWHSVLRTSDRSHRKLRA